MINFNFYHMLLENKIENGIKYCKDKLIYDFLEINRITSFLALC
jgi:hypothetical protein